jgi:hypothetical protein
MKNLFGVSTRRGWSISLSTAILAFICACGVGGETTGRSPVTPQPLVPYTGNTAQTEITTAKANHVLNDLNNSAVTVCTATGPAASKTVAKQQVSKSLLKELTTITRLTKKNSRLRKAPGEQPDDMPGACGGKITYKNWSHSSGTTTATLVFADYCQTGDAGATEIISGEIPFVSAGTPSDSGPVMNKLTASSQKITIIEKSSSGTVQQNINLAFDGFEYTPGTTSAIRISQVVFRDEMTGQQLSLNNFNFEASGTAGGGTSETFSGRLCGGDLGCVDVDTNGTPLITNSLGVLQSGKINITGLNNSKAVLTAVPGVTPGSPSFTVELNGSPMTGVTMTCGQPAGIPLN